jgi:hypothetical protein
MREAKFYPLGCVPLFRCLPMIEHAIALIAIIFVTIWILRVFLSAGP